MIGALLGLFLFLSNAPGFGPLPQLVAVATPNKSCLAELSASRVVDQNTKDDINGVPIDRHATVLRRENADGVIEDLRSVSSFGREDGTCRTLVVETKRTVSKFGLELPIVVAGPKRERPNVQVGVDRRCRTDVFGGKFYLDVNSRFLGLVEGSDDAYDIAIQPYPWPGLGKRSLRSLGVIDALDFGISPEFLSGKPQKEGGPNKGQRSKADKRSFVRLTKLIERINGERRSRSKGFGTGLMFGILVIGAIIWVKRATCGAREEA